MLDLEQLSTRSTKKGFRLFCLLKNRFSNLWLQFTQVETSYSLEICMVLVSNMMISLYCFGQKVEELLVSYVQTSNLYWISLEDRMAGWEVELVQTFNSFFNFLHNFLSQRNHESRAGERPGTGFVNYELCTFIRGKNMRDKINQTSFFFLLR